MSTPSGERTAQADISTKHQSIPINTLRNQTLSYWRLSQAWKEGTLPCGALITSTQNLAEEALLRLKVYKRFENLTTAVVNGRRRVSYPKPLRLGVTKLQSKAKAEILAMEVA